MTPYNSGVPNCRTDTILYQFHPCALSPSSKPQLPWNSTWWYPRCYSRLYVFTDYPQKPLQFLFYGEVYIRYELNIFQNIPTSIPIRDLSFYALPHFPRSHNFIPESNQHQNQIQRPSKNLQNYIHIALVIVFIFIPIRSTHSFKDEIDSRRKRFQRPSKPPALVTIIIFILYASSPPPRNKILIGGGGTFSANSVSFLLCWETFQGNRCRI